MSIEPTWLRIKQTHVSSGLQSVFLRLLGWQAPANQPLSSVKLGACSWHCEVIAELPGAAVIEVKDDDGASAEDRRKLAKVIEGYFPQHILRFSGDRLETWYWPRRLTSGGMALEAFHISRNAMPDFLAQRLSGLKFSPGELSSGLTVAGVRDRLRGTIETTKITSDFYKKFKLEHERLTASITGMPEEAAHGYATLLLNRLMFIWFLQKKQFLNNDLNYLQTCLTKIQELNGQGNFYNFYKDYLLDLFFNYLNANDANHGNDPMSGIIGDIPYVNGGIFGISDAEFEFQDISIPDQAFENIFEFFSSFTWHLDTRPTGDPSEINPEVIGYIFEQYINYTADGKKDSGAYYTQGDVTGYMVSQTLIPAILDRLEAIGFSVFQKLQLNPAEYIDDRLLHGSRQVGSKFEWIPIESNLAGTWLSDPLNWNALDNADPNPEVQLEDETWVETFARRERVLKQLSAIENGDVRSTNDLITFNLDSTKLLLELVAEVNSKEKTAQIFDAISGITVLDPTCGSGAFLFAALGALEPIYQILFERIDALGIESTTHPSNVIFQAKNRNYAIRKHIALVNLHGTDIMPDAIETAKLRIFLALASTLTDRSELEPLPDLDFNLRCGNLVVGFADANDSARMGGGDLFLEMEIRELQPQIDAFEAQVEEFKMHQKNAEPAYELKLRIKELGLQISNRLSRMYASAVGVEANKIDQWIVQTKPFHWLLEFPEVTSRGGFDVVIGNPPYIKMSKVEPAYVTGYETRFSSDFYAICYERSLQLLAPRGRHAFIVMLSLSFSDRFKALRGLIDSRGSAEWWSTYGAWPVQLFPGVRVRNTMLIIGPGEEKFSTRHHIMTSGTRKWQFASMEYASIARAGESLPMRGGVANELLMQLKAQPVQRVPSNAHLYLRGTAAYWFPVFYSKPPALDSEFQIISTDDERSIKVQLFEAEDRELAFAALAGKISYLYWQAYGDDFDVSGSQTNDLRAFTARFATKKLLELAENIKTAAREKYFLSNNAGKFYLGIRWNQLRATTDKFDRALLEEAGMIDFWKPLNIWYRQTMRATRENLNSKPVPSAVVEKFPISD